MKISIVTPSYNQGQFIEDAILSVMNQGHADFEHIIIDGGSKDNTVEILKKYPHLIWVSEPDKGQSDAINKGFNRVTGDVIGWLNSDDYYLPETFQKIIDEFDKGKVEVVYGDVQFVDKHKNMMRIVRTHRPVKWLSLFHCYIHSAAFFFDKRVLDQGVRIDPLMHISMDKELFAHIFYKKYRFKYLPKILTAFRWHENNKSIDTDEVKQIRYSEGLKIYKRYASVKLPLNSKIYAMLTIAFLPVRKMLKIMS